MPMRRTDYCIGCPTHPGVIIVLIENCQPDLFWASVSSRTRH